MHCCKNLYQICFSFLLLLVVTACGHDSSTTTTFELDETVTSEALVTHAERLEQISLDDPLSRSAGSAGYRAAMDYIKNVLAGSGLTIREQQFDFQLFMETEEPRLAMVSPQPETYNVAADFMTLTYSGTGDVVGQIAFISPVFPPGSEANTATDGCNNTNVDTLDLKDKVAVIQRGGCSFAEKVANVEAQGAAAVLIFNEGQEGRTEILAGTLAADSNVNIPVVGTSYAFGKRLYDLYDTGITPILRVAVTAENRLEQTYNLFAETPSGRDDRVIMIGAHLDSVVEGPGINDNASGVAALLEVARQIGRNGYSPQNKIRFAWWGAEEVGLIGSYYYLDNLSPAEREQIAMYLNVDSIASHNFIRGVDDGDLSDTMTAPGASYQETPAGSEVIEEVLLNYFHDRQLPTVATALTGQSDYAGFATYGIPFGGVYSGLVGTKTEEEALLFGGTAGEPYDSCYHRPCDTLANINTQIFTENARAVAHFAQYFGDRSAATLFDQPVAPQMLLASEPQAVPPATRPTDDRYHQDRRTRPPQ